MEKKDNKDSSDLNQMFLEDDIEDEVEEAKIKKEKPP